MAHPIPTAPTGVDADEWASAIASVRSYCGWHIAPKVTEDVVMDGPGCGLLVLPTQLLIDLTAVTSDGHAVTDPEWSASGLVRGGWSSKYRGVTATMTHGYEEWPAELLSVAREMVSAAGRGGVASVGNHQHQVTYEAPLSDRQTSVLDRYRLVDLP